MVEFAFVLPIVLVVLFGVIQFAIVFNSYITITDAARVGARTATVSRTAAQPVATTVTAVRNSAPNLDQTKLQVVVTPNAPWASGSNVTVTVRYPYQINLLGIVVRNGTLSSSTTERVE
jgi:Flp pilus assembly protein TadG